MNVIEVNNLKKYFGKTKAIDGISFNVSKGEIFGFLGPNGAGKTTTIRCMMDFIRPNFGSINILGIDAQKNTAKIKQKIGFLPGNVQLFLNWTGKEHIDLLEKIRGKSKNLPELIEKLNFDPKIKTKYLSSGNKQKLGLILALMSDPELLIMDEPTVGLDPLLQNKIYEILEYLQQQGKTIFMSSHNLPEVERLCKRVGIIKEGELVALETITDLHAKRLHHVLVRFSNKINEKEIQALNLQIEEVLPDGFILAVKGDIDPLIKVISKYKIIDLEITHATLEEVFLEFYKK